jgi:hypothetical protein
MGAEGRVRVAVVTGGHAYDVVNFHRLFRELPGVDAYIQHMDDFASTPAELRDAYDVALFYIMLMEGPTDEGRPWYEGKPRAALSHLGETEQGIVVLHHALLAYPTWELWDEVVGVPDRREFGYDMDQTLRIAVTATEHHITAGLRAWEMVDETYTMNEPGDDNTVLLTTDHPKSMTSIAWTREFRNSRVFCFQSGHDNQTWIDASFREVLARGIQWCARRI